MTSESIRAASLKVRASEYRRRLRDARRALLSGRAVVLAYHQMSDLSHDRVLADFGVPSARLAEQLDALRRRGWTFIDLDTLLRALRGEKRLPRRALLVSFDDGYADLLSAGVPVLAARRIPAVAFAVSGRVGGTNGWDREIGATTLRLLDAEGLRAIAGRGVEVGSHTCTHPRLALLSPHELAAELGDSASQIAALGLPRPRALAYPYGVWNQTVASAVREAGYEAAFTIQPGVVRPGSDLFSLPRIEVRASDTPRRLGLKIATAGLPRRVRPGLLRLLGI